jgi:hypothetical protein
MLRTVSAALLAAAALAGSAAAQDSSRFALGVQAGTTGFGVEGQFQAAPQINLRAGADFFQYDETFSSSDVDYAGEIEFNTASAFVDYHPFDNGFFVSRTRMSPCAARAAPPCRPTSSSSSTPNSKTKSASLSRTRRTSRRCRWCRSA